MFVCLWLQSRIDSILTINCREGGIAVSLEKLLMWLGKLFMRSVRYGDALMTFIR